MRSLKLREAVTTQSRQKRAAKMVASEYLELPFRVLQTKKAALCIGIGYI
ncbi:MAG: hypothetical protein FWG61_07535 [Firmicutes bacterium]|nr:hypothetical protein [Bacillota bacterium]